MFFNFSFGIFPHQNIAQKNFLKLAERFFISIMFSLQFSILQMLLFNGFDHSGKGVCNLFFGTGF